MEVVVEGCGVGDALCWMSGSYMVERLTSMVKGSLWVRR